MWTLLERAVTPGHAYKVFIVKADGSFSRREISCLNTQLRILDFAICEYSNKVFELVEARAIVAQINEIRTNNRMTGHFSVIEDVSRGQIVYRIVFGA